MSETLAPLAAVDAYLAFWNAHDEARQRELASRVFAPDVRYTAPVGVLEGTEALIGFHRQFTGHMGKVDFAARTAPDGHRDRARLQWEIRLGDGTVFAKGTDILTLDGDRIASVTTFLDQAPEGFTPHDDQA
ncbi:nuclear transport factor 2 family protein [Streptomyces sp. NPDC053367]|uniref:nuclear transport factor 2 family protein n=1 Tax=Streptomyces sp. NPDC053367 TaxID=3365700 RepID=UPI0037D740FB